MIWLYAIFFFVSVFVLGGACGHLWATWQIEQRNKEKLCYCGHKRKDHEKYVDNGHNKKGSRYVCTKDNCHRWNCCDL